jgi:hypothetical protein
MSFDTDKRFIGFKRFADIIHAAGLKARNYLFSFVVRGNETLGVSFLKAY